ncbi:MAG: glycosyltransferase family 2 protein [Eubacteriales bacterium]|nr:glycosyltransferase family 2 protein [Eubacteriales bacterium]
MKMQTNDKVLMIIPAYNEAGSIEKVISELKDDYPQYDYVVVTDGSTDGTDRICMENGYNHVRLSANLGLTGCFQTGMKYAYRYGYPYAVQFDGDGQHRPEFIEAMKTKMDEGYDIVMGSRFIMEDGSMKGMRALGSRLIKMAIKLTTGTLVTDPTCGLRMYNQKMIDIFANRLNYAPEPDTISYLIKNGARVAEVPVKVAERESGQSYLKPLNAIKYMLRMLVSIVVIQNFREKG